MGDSFVPSDISDRDELLRLQRLLLPASLPSIGCTETAGAYRAYNHDFRLGGDWFDLVDRPQSNSVVAVVGDVVGHGAEQIVVMGQLRAACNALSHSLTGPGEIVAGLDSFARGLPGAFMTTLSIIVFDGSESAQICSAGHPPPLVVRKNGGVDVIELGRRLPLAVGTSEIVNGRFPLTVGDVVVLYTDGVVERRGELIDEGIQALGEFIAARRGESCNLIAQAIADEFAGDAEDDQAILVLRPIHTRGDTYKRSLLTASSVSWEHESIT